MVQVQLARDWTDATGTLHSAGETVEVDAVTLADLEATGVVQVDKTDSWGGPTGTDSWGGPTGTDV